VLIDGIPPGESPTCGEVDCPPPWIRILDADLHEPPLVEINPRDLGLADGSGFGTVAEWLPDLDKDGYPELAIGAPAAKTDPTGKGSGLVIVVSGRTGKELHRLDGGAGLRGFGATLEVLDKSSFAIGAPGDREVAGAVAIVDLRTFETVRTHRSGQRGDGFGTALAATADVDGDHQAELLVGVPGEGGRGAVYAVLSRDRMRRLGEGSGEGAAFGTTLVALGDPDGNGTSEVLVGAPGANGTRQAGGRVGIAAKAAGAVVLLDLTGKTLWTRNGAEPGERLGSSLAAVAVDGKRGNVTEVLVGAPGWAAETGRAYLLTSRGKVGAVLTGKAKGAQFGRAVAPGPDLDRNGIRSLVVFEKALSGTAGFGRSTLYER
jgi:hypothetical protein